VTENFKGMSKGNLLMQLYVCVADNESLSILSSSVSLACAS